MHIERPEGLDEALAALAADPHATLLAGGTDLMVEVNLAHRRPTSVVALRRVPELRTFDRELIGAGVSWERMARGPLTALAQAARTVGSPQIRAAGTLGGNLGTASPAGDALPWLAALDAEVVLACAQGRRQLAWDAFLLGPGRTARRPGELIVGVALPADPPPHQAFAKVGVRQAMVIATVSCCVVRDAEGTTRVALGAVGPTVLRARRAEALVSGTTRPSAAVLERFETLVREEIAPIDDHRASAAYRRHAAGVLARRTLERCWT